jgi:hypothetical protein
MAEPPLLNGADQLTVICDLTTLTVTLRGAPGTVAGVTELVALEAALVPTRLIAATAKV